MEGQNQEREKNPNWKGGVKIHSGYKYIKLSEHPFCNSHGYVAEHRLIMEKKIGRYLNREEIVHHINGDKQDNTIDNLQILSSEEHNTIHHKNKKQKRDYHGRFCK